MRLVGTPSGARGARGGDGRGGCVLGAVLDVGVGAVVDAAVGGSVVGAAQCARRLGSLENTQMMN